MLTMQALSHIFPPNIHTIAIAAPASPAHDPAMADQAIQTLKRTGLKLIITPHARDGEPGDAYSAIDPTLRARDLEEAWLTPEVQLIVPIRGGGGGLQLVQELRWDKLKARPDMPVMGFSDLTILHAAMLANHCGRPIASPTLLDMPYVTPDSVSACSRTLAGKATPAYSLSVLRAGNACGPVFAAHMQRLASLLNTAFFPNLERRVLFLECPHRNEIRLTEIFRELLGSGKISRIAALVFGQFPDCTSPQAAQDMLLQAARQLPCPVLADFPFGHTPKLHPLDAAATARITQDGTLSIIPAMPL